MKLGIGSYTFGWRAEAGMTPFDLLDEAEELGVDLVQIADNMPLHTLPAQELQAFSAQAARRGIGVEVGTRGIASDHLRRYLEIATTLKSQLLRIVVDEVDDHPEPMEAVASLGRVLPEFEDAGVTIAIENHDRFPAATLRQMMEALESGSAGICLDTANSIGAYEDIEHVFDTLASWVVNLHIKDITIQRLPHLMGFLVEGAPAGKGALDIPALLQRMRSESPREVNAILELWTPPESDKKMTIAKEKRWARESVSYLRTLIAA